MANTNFCKLAVSIAFSLLAATPITASTIPAIAARAIPPAAIPLERSLPDNSCGTDIFVTAKDTCIYVDAGAACSSGVTHTSAYYATGDSKGVTVTFYAQFPKDSSQIAATPRCSLVVTWPCYIESVYWFNDTTLEYTYGGQTYYESCFYGSYELMLNPYYTSAATSKAASETRAQTTAKAASEKQAQTTSPSPTPAVPATQSCQVISYNLFCFFDILIRVPYIGPSDCDATFDALKRKAVAGVELSEWACENENGFIRLRFDLSGKSGFVDEILQSRYPSVDGFNCGICSASNAPMSNSSCHQ